MFHKNKMGSIIRSTGTVFYSLLHFNLRQGFNGLKYVYSVISVIVDSLSGNTKNRESTRSWTARVLHGGCSVSVQSHLFLIRKCLPLGLPYTRDVQQAYRVRVPAMFDHPALRRIPERIPAELRETRTFSGMHMGRRSFFIV